MTKAKPFSFGENWLKYLDEMSADAPERMAAYVADWIGADLSGRRIVDIGSGQGLTSMVAVSSGAEVVSFDLDPSSVTATRRLWRGVGEPDAWVVLQGSILDPAFLQSLGLFDVVISWGVLHHTGRMWEAIDAAASMVRPGGTLWIALYHRTHRSTRSLRTKRFYNRLPGPAKRVFRLIYAGTLGAKHVIRHRSLRRLGTYQVERGMSWRRDIEDWLGGLPYEVASPGQVLARLLPLGFTLERLEDALGEGGNDIYLFRRLGD